MLTSILESFSEELNDSKNIELFKNIASPFLNNIKLFFYLIVFFLLIMTFSNLLYIKNNLNIHPKIE
jgi:hypothetical protein